MKKIAIVGLLIGISIISYTKELSAEDRKDAMVVLEKMRKKIIKEDAERIKNLKIQKELEGLQKRKAAELKKPKTELGKLEETKDEANEQLDFYERVVRSVHREEVDIQNFNDNMGIKTDQKDDEKDSALMDKEVKRIKARIMEINKNSDNYKKIEKDLDQLEKKVERLNEISKQR